MGKIIKDYSFRELEQGYFFIKNAEIVKLMGQFFECAEDANGILLYGYNDHYSGLGFEVLATASLSNGKLKLGKGNDEVSLQLKYSDIAEEETFALSSSLPVWEQFTAKIAKVPVMHEVTESVLATRNVLNLDACRNIEVPDVVTVQLVKGELVEACPVRLEQIQKMFLQGILLAEPNTAFGVHEGDTLNFYNVKNTQGIMCIAVFPED